MSVWIKIIKLGSLPKITIVTRNNLFVKIWADCIRSSPKTIASKQALLMLLLVVFGIVVAVGIPLQLIVIVFCSPIINYYVDL